MKAMTALNATALICAAVVLGLLTVQGSLALWSMTAASAAGSIQAADFAVTVTAGDGQQQRLSANGLAATVQLAKLPPLERGTPVVVPVVVTNATNAGSGTFTIRTTAGTPVVSGAFADHVDTAVSLASGGTCATRTAGSIRDIGQGASGTFCLTLTIRDTAPYTLAGSGGTVSVAVIAQQL